MKKAVVLVKKCEWCPFVLEVTNAWGRPISFRCEKQDKPVNPDTIDKDCPLEDASEKEGRE